MSKFSFIENMLGILSIPYQIPFLIHENVVKKVPKSDLLFLVRRIINTVMNTIVNSLLVIELRYLSAVVIMFIITTIIAVVFLYFSDWLENDAFQLEALKLNKPTKPDVVTDFLQFVKKRNKILLKTLLFFIEPLYYVIYCRSGYYRYNGFVNFKTFLKFFASSLVASVIWSLIMWFGKNIVGPNVLMIISIVILIVFIPFSIWKAKKNRSQT